MKNSLWNELELEINLCSKCNLQKISKNQIIGKGNKKSEILFVLNEISYKEDERRELLVDKNGEYFKKFLKFSKIDIKNCYFTTLTKCSSHGELIKKDNISKCKDFLISQIALLNPKVIVTVGENATKEFVDINKDIREIIGNVYDYIGGIKIVPIYDIEYLFRATDKEKWKLIEILSNIL